MLCKGGNVNNVVEEIASLIQLHVTYNLRSALHNKIKLFITCSKIKPGYIKLLKCCCVALVICPAVSGLRVTAQDLQTQGDVVDPTPRVDAEVAAEQRKIKNGESFVV